MALLHVVRVFTDETGKYGNPLGVFVEEDGIDSFQQQRIATALGFSETVFVENARDGRLRMYTPRRELPFAGHPLLGTAWLLVRLGHHVQELKAPAAAVPVWRQDGLTTIRGRTEWCPTWHHLHMSSVEEVEQATEAPAGHDAVQVWSFVDDQIGLVRARTFAPRFGVTEDEACGSASMILAQKLGRALTIRHGQGSEIYVEPTGDGSVKLSGRVAFISARAVSLDLEEIMGAEEKTLFRDDTPREDPLCANDIVEARTSDPEGRTP